MAGLSDESKAIITQYPIRRRLALFHEDYHEFVSKAVLKPSHIDIAGSAITDRGIFL
jgi:hypothetical protein